MSAITPTTARVPVEGDTPDGIVLVDGEPVQQHDAGSIDGAPCVVARAEIDEEPARVYVAYSDRGIRGVSIEWQLSGLEAELEENHAENHYRYELHTLGIKATVEIVPENEVLQD